MSITIPVELTLTGDRAPQLDWSENRVRRTSTFTDRASDNAVDGRTAAPLTRFDLLNALRVQLLARADVASAEVLTARGAINELAATFIVDGGPTPQAIRGDRYFEVQWLVNGQSVVLTVDDDGEKTIAAYSDTGETLIEEDFRDAPAADTADIVRTTLRAMSRGIATRAAY